MVLSLLTAFSLSSARPLTCKFSYKITHVLQYTTILIWGFAQSGKIDIDMNSK